ncbi:prephenate dehydrogenase [soil metagenome]
MIGPLTGPVLVIGTGLLGTSIGLACRRAGLEVLLSDPERSHVTTASGLGAGRPIGPTDAPQVVVVAVPPAHLGEVIATALDSGAEVVTDVGSIKSGPLAHVSAHPRLAHYVGGHPMAGSERSGPLAASAALFDGRPWAITPHAASQPEAVAVVEELATLCGAAPHVMDPDSHDRAVARTSHLPHLMAALTAGQLAQAPVEELLLSGQGVRDVTRVAGGAPDLYAQIIGGNAIAVAALLRQVRAELDGLIDAVGRGDERRLIDLLATGVQGTRAIPGKHGGPAVQTVSVWVSVPDEPGSLRRLFDDVADLGVNIEDLRIDHDPGRETGLVELFVAHSQSAGLVDGLESRGWLTHR